LLPFNFRPYFESRPRQQNNINVLQNANEPDWKGDLTAYFEEQPEVQANGLVHVKTILNIFDLIVYI